MNPELIKSLNEILSFYRYRGINWISRVGKPVIFPKERAIIFENFFSAEGNAYEGVCQELTFQAFLDIKKYHKDLYDDIRLYRVTGGAPTFFSSPPMEIVDRFGTVIQSTPRAIRGRHIFLAITDIPILNYGETLMSQQAYDALIKANAYIFDPSFRSFQPLNESGYLIDQVWAPGCKLGVKTGAEIFSNHHILSSNSIIGMSNGVIISLNAYFTEKYPSKEYTIELQLITPMSREPMIVALFGDEITYLVKYLKDLDILLIHSNMEWKTATEGSDLKAYGKQAEYW